MALPPVPMPDPNARRGLAQPAAKRSVLWSVLGILGEVLMTLAAVCALYVVWQMWWTGVQSEHTQVETRQSASWSDPAGGDSSKVAKAQSGDVPVQPTSASDGELIAQVYVPRFGQGWVRNVVEGTDEAELSLHGLGHYPSTQMPGSVGNFAVAGHRNGYGRPLGDVDLLQEGDAIIVRTKDYWYVYKYTTYKIVTPEHSEVIAANPEDLNTPPSKRMITLTTCEPKYTTATHRWISYGELSYWAKVSDGVPQGSPRRRTRRRWRSPAATRAGRSCPSWARCSPSCCGRWWRTWCCTSRPWWPGGTRCCARFAPASAAVRTRASTDGCCVTSPVRW